MPDVTGGLAVGDIRAATPASPAALRPMPAGRSAAASKLRCLATGARKRSTSRRSRQLQLHRLHRHAAQQCLAAGKRISCRRELSLRLGEITGRVLVLGAPPNAMHQTKYRKRQNLQTNTCNFRRTGNSTAGAAGNNAYGARGDGCDGDVVPTVIASHVVLDVPTLFAVTLFITVIGGLLLLFAFLQNRNTPALALWGIGYLVGAAGAALLAGQAAVPNSWSVCGANALLCPPMASCGAAPEASKAGASASPCWQRARRSGSAPSNSKASAAIDAGAHPVWSRRSRGPATRCSHGARALVRARPRSDLALADIGAGRRACGFSSGAHPLCGGIGILGHQRPRLTVRW